MGVPDRLRVGQSGHRIHNANVDNNFPPKYADILILSPTLFSCPQTEKNI